MEETLTCEICGRSVPTANITIHSAQCRKHYYRCEVYHHSIHTADRDTHIAYHDSEREKERLLEETNASRPSSSSSTSSRRPLYRPATASSSSSLSGSRPSTSHSVSTPRPDLKKPLFRSDVPPTNTAQQTAPLPSSRMMPSSVSSTSNLNLAPSLSRPTTSGGDTKDASLNPRPAGSGVRAIRAIQRHKSQQVGGAESTDESAPDGS